MFNKVEKVLYLAFGIVAMYLLLSVFTLHQCHAGPAYTNNDENYDCRTMGNRQCTDTGAGQGGRFHTPGNYSPGGVWQSPL